MLLLDHLLVNLMRKKKSLIAASSVMSVLLYLFWVPYSPPNKKGFHGKEMQILFPGIIALNF